MGTCTGEPMKLGFENKTRNTSTFERPSYVLEIKAGTSVGAGWPSSWRTHVALGQYSGSLSVSP